MMDSSSGFPQSNKSQLNEQQAYQSSNIGQSAGVASHSYLDQASIPDEISQISKNNSNKQIDDSSNQFRTTAVQSRGLANSKSEARMTRKNWSKGMQLEPDHFYQQPYLIKVGSDFPKCANPQNFNNFRSQAEKQILLSQDEETFKFNIQGSNSTKRNKHEGVTAAAKQQFQSARRHKKYLQEFEQQKKVQGDQGNNSQLFPNLIVSAQFDNSEKCTVAQLNGLHNNFAQEKQNRIETQLDDQPYMEIEFSPGQDKNKQNELQIQVDDSYMTLNSVASAATFTNLLDGDSSVLQYLSSSNGQSKAILDTQQAQLHAKNIQKNVAEVRAGKLRHFQTPINQVSVKKFRSQYKRIQEEVDQTATIKGQKRTDKHINRYNHFSPSSQSKSLQYLQEKSRLQEKMQIYDQYLKDPKTLKNQKVFSVHRMPEPSKKYVKTDRSPQEQKLIVNQLQNMFRYKEITEKSIGKRSQKDLRNLDSSIQQQTKTEGDQNTYSTQSFGYQEKDHQQPHFTHHSVQLKTNTVDKFSQQPMLYSQDQTLRAQQLLQEKMNTIKQKQKSNSKQNDASDRNRHTKTNWANWDSRQPQREKAQQHYRSISTQIIKKYNGSKVPSNPQVNQQTYRPTIGQSSHIVSGQASVSPEVKIKMEITKQEDQPDHQIRNQITKSFSNKFEKVVDKWKKGVIPGTNISREVMQNRYEKQKLAKNQILHNKFDDDEQYSQYLGQILERKRYVKDGEIGTRSKAIVKSNSNKQIAQNSEQKRQAEEYYDPVRKIDYLNMVTNNFQDSIISGGSSIVDQENGEENDSSPSQMAKKKRSFSQSSSSKFFSKDLAIISTQQNRDHFFNKNHVKDLTNEQKQKDVVAKISEQQRTINNQPKMDNQETLKLMEETKENYQEFIINKQLISRFDPRRKDLIVKKQLASQQNHRDYTKFNILKTQKNDYLVKEITKRNFQKIFDQNMIRLVEDTGQKREDVINIYTRFVSIFMLQQLDNPNFESLELSKLQNINLETIIKTGKNLKLQSKQVVKHMLDFMRLNSSDGKGQLSWDDFRTMLLDLMPMTLEDQITLFLKAYVPKTVLQEDIERYEFGQADILKISKQCLEPLFLVTDDEFFKMLYTNYAQIIYQIIGLSWSKDPAQESKITLRRLRLNICKAEGYEKDMLTLMYGNTGIINLEQRQKDQHILTQDKIEL